MHEDSPTTDFSATLAANATFVRAVARSLVRDRDAAEDVAQDTLTAALARPPRNVTSLRGWLATAARHLAGNRRRADERRAAREIAAPPPSPLPTPDQIAERESLRRRVVEAVLALDEPYRATVIARYFADEPPAAVAARLGLPIETVRTRLKRAHELLRARLEPTVRSERRAYGAALAGLAGLESPAPAIGALTGILLMKTKLLGIAAVVALAAGAWWFVRTDEATISSERESVANAAPPPLASPAVVADTTPATATSRDPVAASAPAVARGMHVRGRCIAREGTPVGGTRVWIVSGDRTRADAMLDTGADGRFDGAITDPPPVPFEVSVSTQRSSFVMASADTLATEIADVELGDLVMEPGGDLRGFVVDEHDRPIANAIVEVGEQRINATRARVSHQAIPGTRIANTDEDGSFELSGVPLRWVRVFADTGDAPVAWCDPIAVRPGAQNPVIRIHVAHPGREHYVSGVLVGVDHAPLADLNVNWTARKKNSMTASSVRTGADGRFRVLALPDEVFELMSRDPDGRRVYAHGLTAGAEVRLEFARGRPTGVRLIAEDTREAIESYSLAMWSRSFGSNPGRVHPGGVVTFEIGDDPISLNVSSPGFLPLSLAAIDPSQIGETWELEMRRGGSLSGRVTDSDGLPVAGARVVAEIADKTATVAGFTVRVRPNWSATGDSFYAATTASDGAFRMHLEREDTLVLRADAPGFAPAITASFHAGPTDTKSDFMIPLAMGGTLEGVVEVPPGRNPGGIIVAISNGDGHPMSKRTQADGSYRFEHLTPGQYEVELRDQEILPGRLSWQVGPDAPAPAPDCTIDDKKVTRFDPRLAPRPRCVVTGRCLIAGRARANDVVQLLRCPELAHAHDLAGSPQLAWDALMSGESEEIARTTPDGDGAFSLDAPSPGAFVLALIMGERRSCHVLVAKPVQVEIGEIRQDLRMDVGTISLQMAAATPGKSIDPQSVVFRGQPTSGGVALASGVFGTDETLDFPAGRVTIETDAGIREIEVKPNETTTVDLR